MSKDAVIWRAHAPDLLGSVPKAWRGKLVEVLLADGREFRAAQESEVGYFPEVRSSIMRPGLSLLRCWGEQPYHVDMEFARYTHLLILRSGRFKVVGESGDSGYAFDWAGRLICLDTHRFHALVSHDSGAEPRCELEWRCWAAVALDSWVALEPAQARAAMVEALNFDAKAKSNLMDMMLERAA